MIKVYYVFLSLLSTEGKPIILSFNYILIGAIWSLASHKIIFNEPPS